MNREIGLFKDSTIYQEMPGAAKIAYSHLQKESQVNFARIFSAEIANIDSLEWQNDTSRIAVRKSKLDESINILHAIADQERDATLWAERIINEEHEGVFSRRS